MINLKNVNLDKIFATLISLLSLILTLYLFFGSERVRAYSSVYLIISVLTLVYCLIYLFNRNNSSILKVVEYKTKKNTLFLFYIFLVLYIYSIYLIYNGIFTYQISINYYFSIALMCGIILLEIFYSNKSMRYLILFQIIIFSINISISKLIIFPSILGVDPFWHSMIVNQIISSNYIPIGPYQSLPFFHLIITFASIILNIDYKNATILVIILPQIILNILFLYVITLFIFKKYKISLITSLVLTIGNYFIQFNSSPIPNSLGALFLIIIIYLLITNKFPKVPVITIIFMLTVILTHTVISLSTSIALYIYWLTNKIYSYMNNIKIDNSIYFKISTLFTIGMISYWIFVSSPLISIVQFVTSSFSIDYFLNLSSQTSNYFINAVSPFEQILDLIGTYLFFSTAILGILFMISKKANIKSFFIASLAILFLSISFISLILGRYILNDRWYYITNVILSIPLSASILILSNIMSTKIYKSIIPVAFIIILAFANIANNSSITPNTNVRYTYIKTEISAASYVTKNYLGRISSDFYSTNPSSGIFQNIFNIDDILMSSFDDSLLNSKFVHDNSIKVIRKDIVYNPFMVENGIWRLTYDPNKLLIDSGFDRIYDNGGVWIYR